MRAQNDNNELDQMQIVTNDKCEKHNCKTPSVFHFAFDLNNFNQNKIN